MRLGFRIRVFIVICVGAISFTQPLSPFNGGGKQVAEYIPQLDQLVVKKCDLNLGWKESRDGEHLWKNFANRKELEQFHRMPVRAWRDLASKFSEALVAKAEKLILYPGELEKCLELLRKSEDETFAYVPVAAYLCRKGKEPVYVILRVWEYAISSEREMLGHIQIDALSLRTFQILSSSRCG